jgi:membrane-associated protease RseP (regulator of RpoE activity)
MRAVGQARVLITTSSSWRWSASVSGVLNLLPIPVLDGGHLLYHMIEVVRRRPLSERAMEIGQQIGVFHPFHLDGFCLF